MIRPYYSDYVTHCMNFYARYPNPTFRTEIDKLNWKACDYAIRKFSPVDREILLSIYRERDSLADNVYEISVSLKVNQDKVWSLISELERNVAKRRKLI